MSVRFVGNVQLIPTYIFYSKFGICGRFFSAVDSSGGSADMYKQINK